MATANIGLGLGNIAAMAVCLSSKYNTKLSWQTPTVRQLSLAVILDSA